MGGPGADARGAGVRWVDAANPHVTLRFLGNVPPERLEAVREAGREAARRRPPFLMTLGGFGTFPPRGPARVFWAGVAGGLPECARLAEYLDEALAARGFAADHEAGGRPGSRRPAFHVTLARIKSAEAGLAIARALDSRIVPKVDKEIGISVYNVEQIDSDLRPGGPIYTVMESFPLTGPGS